MMILVMVTVMVVMVLIVVVMVMVMVVEHHLPSLRHTVIHLMLLLLQGDLTYLCLSTPIPLTP